MISRALADTTATQSSKTVPDGIELTGMVPPEASAVRSFCLATIAEAFGHGYQPDWHNDLDRLGTDSDGYAPQRGGTFVVERRRGAIMACGGMRPLATKPAIHARFASRYTEPERVTSLWRVYVDADMRGSGIGSQITQRLELAAIEAGYRHCYLHTSGRRSASVAFWASRSYRPFEFDADPDQTVHLDRQLPTAHTR